MKNKSTVNLRKWLHGMRQNYFQYKTCFALDAEVSDISKLLCCIQTLSRNISWFFLFLLSKRIPSQFFLRCDGCGRTVLIGAVTWICSSTFAAVTAAGTSITISILIFWLEHEWKKFLKYSGKEGFVETLRIWMVKLGCCNIICALVENSSTSMDWQRFFIRS